jgi:hypothetical protein
MTDELKKKTEAVGVAAAEPPAGEGKPDVTPPAPAQPAVSAGPTPEAPAKGGPPPKKEKPDKCEQCGKNLSRIKWYYRDGGYYCTRRCWKEFAAKQKEEKAAPSAGAKP